MYWKYSFVNGKMNISILKVFTNIMSLATIEDIFKKFQFLLYGYMELLLDIQRAGYNQVNQ